MTVLPLPPTSEIEERKGGFAGARSQMHYLCSCCVRVRNGIRLRAKGMVPARAFLKLALACAGAALAVSGCAREAERKLAVGSDQGRPGKLYYRPHVQPAAAPV